MTIEKLHGLHSTNISISDRFTQLAAIHYARLTRLTRLRRRSLSSYNTPLGSRNVRVNQPARRQNISQRLGLPAMRRFGSEANIPRLRRSNSVGSLQINTPSRIRRTSFNGYLSRASSVSSLPQSSWRGRGGYRRRGGAGPMRGRLRGSGRGVVRQQMGQLQGQSRGQPRGMRGHNRGMTRSQSRGMNWGQSRGPMRGRGRGRPRGRGGLTQNQGSKPLVTKEELDAQLDQYMATTRLALDKELDEYMKNSLMEVDNLSEVK